MLLSSHLAHSQLASTDPRPTSSTQVRGLFFSRVLHRCGEHRAESMGDDVSLATRVLCCIMGSIRGGPLAWQSLELHHAVGGRLRHRPRRQAPRPAGQVRDGVLPHDVLVPASQLRLRETKLNDVLQRASKHRARRRPPRGGVRAQHETPGQERRRRTRDPAARELEPLASFN